MPTIKLTLAYDGTDFCGWQIQPGQPTVQGLLADVLQQITQQQVAVHGAGRTDAGVHAWGQVASFHTESSLAPATLQRALNALLPPSVRIRSAEEAAAGFHARWLASAKTYEYRIHRDAVVPPFLWRYVLHDPFPLDFAAMADAARLFEGERDFTSFAASTGSDDEDRDRVMVRAVYRSEMLRAPCLDTDGEQWMYVVRGKSFLRHMVRKMVGTLLEVGRGRLAASDISRILERRDPTCSGPTAPPHGLSLVSVEYPDPPGPRSEP